MELAAVAVSATDLPRAIAFYEGLGFCFPPLQPGEDHVESTGSPKLMIDTHELMTGLLGEPPRPGNHAAIALLCSSPAEVDDVAGRAGELGSVVTAPWNAPWAQRYATVADPDGYRVDLYAPLPG